MQKAFVSYSHKDVGYRKTLESWLQQLKSDSLLRDWSDTRIVPGEVIDSIIDENLRDSDIAICLLSQDYLSSDSCRKELEFALDESNNCHFVPVIVRPCSWADTPTRRHLALPEDGKAISIWPNQDEAFNSIYEGLKVVVKKLSVTFTPKADFVRRHKEIEFVTQARSDLHLDSIWVMPTLHEKTEDFPDTSFDSIVNFLSHDTNRCIIEGEELAGKSALAFKLFEEAFDIGLYPILLNGTGISKTRQFDEHFRFEFGKQLTGDYERWKVTPGRIAIIDDFSHTISRNIINYLEEHFDQIILIISTDIYLTYFSDDELLSSYTVFSLDKLTHLKQEELIKQWLRVSLSDDYSNFELEQRVDQIETKINSIVSRNQIVPRYPFYVLSILQTLEAFMPTDYQITAYGHCYNALITAQLLKKSIPADDIESCYNYLMELSYSIFSSDTFGEEQYCDFKSDYRNRYIILGSTLNRLENDQYPLIRSDSDGTTFVHKYIYYYFLGMYFATGRNKSVLTELCEDIHVKENAFIVIFTVHHSQDRDLLDEIIVHALFSFEGSNPARLDKAETKFMESLVAELPKSILSDKEVKTNREEERKLRDDSENQAKNDFDHDPELIEINKALRLIDVLGQIAKNRYGSFEKDKISEVVESVQDLGLRILDALLSSMRDPDFENWILSRVSEAEHDRRKKKDKENDLSDDEVKQIVVKSIRFISFLTTFSIINKIVDAIGSEKIDDIVQGLKHKLDSPAYDLIAFITSIKHSKPRPEKIKQVYDEFRRNGNLLAMQIASYFIQDYLNTHSLEVREKKIICSAIGIAYKV